MHLCLNNFRPFHFPLEGLYSVAYGGSSWNLDTETLHISSTDILYNNHTDADVNDDNNDSPLWMILMDRSQLVMTIVGFVANMATSITLVKNGQVQFLLSYTFKMYGHMCVCVCVHVV